jgi:hypothetical protein
MRPPPRPEARTWALTALVALASAGCASLPRGHVSVQPFRSDGCSLFPDGSFAEPGKWCDCCLRHDVAYWRGGSAVDRLAADRALRDCVRERTGDPVLAEAMFLGARAGGASVFPTWYRWGYGWPYGRGDRTLSAGEEAEADAELEAYRVRNPDLRCGPGGAPLSASPQRRHRAWPAGPGHAAREETPCVPQEEGPSVASRSSPSPW